MLEAQRMVEAMNCRASTLWGDRGADRVLSARRRPARRAVVAGLGRTGHPHAPASDQRSARERRSL